MVWRDLRWSKGISASQIGKTVGRASEFEGAEKRQCRFDEVKTRDRRNSICRAVGSPGRRPYKLQIGALIQRAKM